MQSSLLFQLHTHHIPLNLHLHHINKTESPCCPTCNALQETIYRFLLECLAYNTHQEPLQHQWKHLSQDIAYLLSKLKAIMTIINYMCAIGHLCQSLGELQNHS